MCIRDRVYDARTTSGLNAQQIRIVERSYDEMVRDGANLSTASKSKLVAMNSKLEGLFSAFSSKLLGDEKLYTFVTDKAELAGLDAGFTASLAAAAEANGKPGQWAIKNTRSSAQPVLQNATNRALREKVYKAFVSRGDNGDANDTNATIAEILKLRQQRAELLGFPNHATYRMADTMAKTPANAMALLLKVWPAAVARAKEEVADMQAIADAEAKAGKGPKITIEPWDYRFYSEKVRKAKYDLDESEVKPYLQLDKLVEGMFWSAGQLYDLGFRENTGTIPVFDPKVRTFEVYNLKSNANVGVFYLDNFARDGKRSGAWMTTYRSQQTLGGERNVLASNNNNFTEAAKGEPTLISLDDASTLFHEFGHALHAFVKRQLPHGRRFKCGGKIVRHGDKQCVHLRLRQVFQAFRHMDFGFDRAAGEHPGYFLLECGTQGVLSKLAEALDAHALAHPGMEHRWTVVRPAGTPVTLILRHQPGHQHQTAQTHVRPAS